jgi:hypothetical protein
MTTRRVRLLPLLGVLLSGIAFATVASTHSWTSSGVKYFCQQSATGVYWKCISPTGGVVYVTGDTENGCHGDGKHAEDYRLIRTEKTACYRDINADPGEALAELADLLGSSEEPPLEQDETLVYGDTEQASNTTKARESVSDEELALVEVEAVTAERNEAARQSREEHPEVRFNMIVNEEGPSQLLGVALIQVPCDDDQPEGDDAWSEEITKQ